jgi:chromate transporter
MSIDGERLRRDMDRDPPRQAPAEVLRAFLKLGLTSFGGPIAHIGFFREEFVKRRRWLTDAAFTDLVALCQFLPGPASSQVGFSIGLIRAGYLGGLAAWTGFTLPSALVLLLFAYGARTLSGTVGLGLLHGLNLVAVAIVAQAIFGMARALCPDLRRAGIAVLTMTLVLFRNSSVTQIAAMLLGGIAGYLACRSPTPAAAAPLMTRVSRRVGLAALTVFTLLLVGLPLFRMLGAPPGAVLFDAFYRSGALVFGGGHVVLPLLRDSFVASGWVSEETFFAGYGAAQAVPGPLFTFAAYLGAVVKPSPHGVVGSIIGLFGIFLPGILVLLGTLPFWDFVRTRTSAYATMRGVGAAVVGLLAATFVDPLWIGTVNSTRDFVAATIGFLLLTVWQVRPVLVVLLGAVAGIALSPGS